jgi:hypothetical protein
MANFYVKTDGLNTNNGSSWALAFKQLVKAEEEASDGDTVYVESGEYIEPSASDGTSGVIAFAKSIIWIADDGDGGDGTVLVKAYSGATAPSAGSATSFDGIQFKTEPMTIGTTNTVTEPASIGTAYTTTE